MLSAISVDLDSLTHYCRIQGLPESLLDERARSLVAEKAIPRFLELFAAVKAPATFFVIGGDVALPGMKRALRASLEAGVELASHTQSHAYEISRWPKANIEADLVRCEEALAEVGRRWRGNRNPRGLFRGHGGERREEQQQGQSGTCRHPVHLDRDSFSPRTISTRCNQAT
jgi:hypothetical protein